jgi:hypothetical protein
LGIFQANFAFESGDVSSGEDIDVHIEARVGTGSTSLRVSEIFEMQTEGLPWLTMVMESLNR